MKLTRIVTAPEDGIYSYRIYQGEALYIEQYLRMEAGEEIRIDVTELTSQGLRAKFQKSNEEESELVEGIGGSFEFFGETPHMSDDEVDAFWKQVEENSRDSNVKFS